MDMESSIEKIKLFRQPVGGKVSEYNLTMKGEEQEDGSLLVRFCAVQESGILILLPPCKKLIVRVK